MNQVNIASVRTVSLLSAVEDKIRAEPHVFTKFVEILKSEPTLRSQAEDLLREYHYGTYVVGIAYCVHLLIDAHCNTVHGKCSFRPLQRRLSMRH